MSVTSAWICGRTDPHPLLTAHSLPGAGKATHRVLGTLESCCAARRLPR